MPTFGKDDYTPLQAVKSTAKNALAIPWFVAGSYLGILAAGWALWLRRRDRSIVVLVALFLAFPLGYFVFWGMHVSSVTAHLSGPIYFIPLFPPLLVLMAAAIHELWTRRQAFGALAGAVLVVVTVPFAVSRLDANHTMSAAQVPWKDSNAAVPDNSLVFVEQAGAYLLLLNPYSSNTANLDGPVLYATDQGVADLDLIASRPGRTPYLQKTSVPPSEADPTADVPSPKITLVPIRVLTTGAAVMHTRITNTTGERVVVASLQLGDRIERRTLTTEGARGQVYDVEWVVAAPGAGRAGATTIDVPAVDAIVSAGFGATVREATRRPNLRGWVPTRNDGSSLRMMLPVRVARAGQVNDHPGWIEVDQAPDFVVTVTADSAP
jgi:hypothetical protein